MDDLISINSFPVREVLNKLLSDKSTGKNIIFATDTYRFYLGECSDKDQMTGDALRGFGAAKIQPRVRKAQEQQSERTRKKAEVFTPTWIVKKMNDECEKDWQSMLGDDWKKIVLLRVLEITCGEAPFLATRYDTTTGDALPISQRVGMLDRKLRLVCENAKDEAEWLEWAVKAMESTYGYEYQGDNLLIGRINLLITFCDYMQEYLKRQPTKSELSKITNIIAWNLWQMDGLKDAVPLGMSGEDDYAYSLFGEESEEKPHEEIACMIYNWRRKRSLMFKDIKEGKTKMKFDYVIGIIWSYMILIAVLLCYNRNSDYTDLRMPVKVKIHVSRPLTGILKSAETQISDRSKAVIVQSRSRLQIIFNPPYQEEISSNADNSSLSKQLFPYFIKGSIDVSKRCVVLITPSRWFAGDAQDKSFVKLRDFFKSNQHIHKIVHYPNENDVFSNVVVKGGVSYFSFLPDYSGNVEFSTVQNGKETIINRPLFIEGLEVVLTDPIKISVLQKVRGITNDYLTNLTKGRNAFGIVGKDSVVNEISSPEKFDNCCELRIKGDGIRYISEDKVTKNIDVFNSYKIFISKSAGAPNKDKKVIGMSYVGKPKSACTDSLIPIGCFRDEIEAINLRSYMCTKFLRYMVSILKVSQNVTQIVYKYVPLQNFTENSDIDWSVSIPEIDRQLYKKYGLSEEEIDFIETHVKEMV